MPLNLNEQQLRETPVRKQGQQLIHLGEGWQGGKRCLNVIRHIAPYRIWLKIDPLGT